MKDEPRTKASEIVEHALTQGCTTLSEFDAKCILSLYGIPVIQERLAQDVDEAVAAAEALGYPVAVKACAVNLPHKSDLGLVRLGLNGPEALRRAVKEIRPANPAAPGAGFLVQRMARGKREVIAGGVRDALFGPCVLLGLGGIAVEALGDVAFRLPPLDERDTAEMTAELQGNRIFEAFRGEPAIPRQELHRVLQGIAALLEDVPAIAQVDINPLVVENGALVAVDALINVQAAPGGPGLPPAAGLYRNDQFLALFEPQSLAIVGVSDSPLKWGFRILFNTLEGGYTGRLYGVNPKHDSLMGVPCFPSITALPEAVDLALIVVPPKSVLPALEECAAKGVKAVLIITAGFAELEDAKAHAAQARLVTYAQDSGLLVVGPNCAGAASPEPAHLYSGMISRFPGPGGLSVVSQSGNVGSTVLTWASVHHVGIARFISTGNEAAAATPDYLDFLAQDARTTSIITYLEGVRNGPRLYASLRRAAQAKPVVLIKGGRSTVGMNAARSHTGALATETRVLEAVYRQAGVTIVRDVYEAMEVAAALMNQPLPQGRRVAIVSQGGGWGVIGADACAEAGLEVVKLPASALAELDGFLPGWWNRNNPIDLVAGTDLETIPRTVECMLRCPAVDAVIMLGIGYIASAVARYENSPKAQEIGLDKLAAMGCEMELNHARRMAACAKEAGKPLMVASDTVLLAYGRHPNEVIAELERLGVYAFSSPAHVARALAHMAERYEFLHGVPRSAKIR